MTIQLSYESAPIYREIKPSFDRVPRVILGADNTVYQEYTIAEAAMTYLPEYHYEGGIGVTPPKSETVWLDRSYEDYKRKR